MPKLWRESPTHSTRWRWAILLVIGIACVALLGVSCWPRPSGDRVHGNGLFSWRGSVLEEREDLFRRMETLGLTELYQHIPEKTDLETVESFLAAAAERNIDVYLLTGDPSWGLDKTGQAIQDEIARAASYQKQRHGGLRGIMLDVEPYLTEEWDRDRDDTMERYVGAMTQAKKSADKAGLELVACIPYFYDNKEQTEKLQTLVKEGCHAVAVMNYYKSNEVENLATEAALAAKYNKPLITIYELQAPGTHDLTERNTYYNDGLDAIQESWEIIRQAYGDGKLTYALHHAQVLEEVMGD